MENYILFIILAILMLLLGFFIGQKTASSKKEGQTKDLENHITTATLQAKHAEDLRKEERENYQQQISKIETENRQKLDELKKELVHIRQEKEQLHIQLTRRNTEFSNLQQKANEEKAEIKKLQEKFEKEFENLANKILEQKSEKFTQLNKTNIENILTPLQKKIKDFEEKVDKNREASLKRHTELGKHLDQLNKQNLKISEEATNLTKALKGDSKMQGNWGEMVLRRVLERSGLQKDSEYFEQQSFTTEQNKRVMPDVVIHLPGDKKMIIDSKVSLTAYEHYINAEESTAKKNYLNQHLASIKKHVDELSRKNYQQLYQMESPDFTLLFIPIEAAFALASNAHPGLYGDAFDKNIIIVTPTTLLAVLKTIDSMWQNERQRKNSIEIATQAGRLYDTFVNLITDFEKVGKQLKTVQGSYDSTMKKLTGKGNLVSRVENLKKLGAKASKQIDQKHLNQTDDYTPLNKPHENSL